MENVVSPDKNVSRMYHEVNSLTLALSPTYLDRKHILCTECEVNRQSYIGMSLSIAPID